MQATTKLVEVYQAGIRQVETFRTFKVRVPTDWTDEQIEERLNKADLENADLCDYWGPDGSFEDPVVENSQLQLVEDDADEDFDWSVE